MTTRNGWSILMLTMLLTGCSIFSRPDNQFYSLDTIESDAPVVSISGAPLAIDGAELPPTLDRRGIVVRGADHGLEVRGTHQWAAPLETMVLHTLAFNLADRLPEGMVVLPGQGKPGGATRSVYLVLEELAAGPEPQFVLDGRWTMNDSSSGAAFTQHERITVDLPSMESAEVAAAMSQALATLADRIAARIAGG